jgi:trehalose 6-phosphate synthase
MSDLVVVANRGPVSLSLRDGELVAEHAQGGLAPSLARALDGQDVLWIASALGDAERRAMADGRAAGLLDGVELDYLDLGPEVLHDAYSVIANTTLWYLYHGLFEEIGAPAFDDAWWAAFEHYRSFNRAFAEEIARRAAPGATVLVNDYHLALVGSALLAERPDLKTVFFSHTPFCTLEELAQVPTEVARELVSSMASFGACGFHTAPWAAAFSRAAKAIGENEATVFVSPLGVDAEELHAVADSPEVAGHKAELIERLGDRRLLARSDRIEPSKNLVRGFLAYETMLEREPQLAPQVLFVARCYPSRTDLEDYLAYRRAVEEVVDRINERFAHGGEPAVLLETNDDYRSSLALLSVSDVLLVNPIRDGMNLVAKEGPILNEVHGALVLSEQAGAYQELAPVCLGVDAFDVEQTANQLRAALAMPSGERVRSALALANLGARHAPREWLADVLSHARRPGQAAG